MTARKGIPALSRTTWVAATAIIALGMSGCASSAPSSDPSEATENGEYQEVRDLLPESIVEAGVLSFGAAWETPPVISVDPADQTRPVGIAPDLADAMGEIFGLEVEWQNLPWPSQLPGVQSGNVDVLFGQVSDTEERELSVVDLIPFQKVGWSMLLVADNPLGAESIADLCGATVGVPIGSEQGEVVAGISDASCTADPITVTEYQGATAVVPALRGGTVDAWIDTSSSVDEIAASDAEAFTAVEVPEDEKTPSLTGIAVSKENPGLSEAIAAALKILIEDGSYEEVFAAYDQKATLIATEVEVNPITGTPAGETAQ